MNEHNCNLHSDHASRAIEIMEKLLPSKHLMLAGAKRVKALILEEIALDSSPMSDEENLLLKSEGLHLSALLLAQTAFGERNVQTAKHYGNLGRLYQSMRRFEVSMNSSNKIEAVKTNMKVKSVKKRFLTFQTNREARNYSAPTYFAKLLRKVSNIILLEQLKKDQQATMRSGEKKIMNRLMQEAEIMHLKAIGIKKEILGPDDYELALSIGHLASLYNFHMGRYRDAEQLYLRSIAISKYPKKH